LYFPTVLYRELDPLSSLAKYERFSPALRIAERPPRDLPKKTRGRMMFRLAV
jgi:hypothetical protein